MVPLTKCGERRFAPKPLLEEERGTPPSYGTWNMYGRLPHGFLIQPASRLGMPNALVRASIRLYRLPRFICLAGTTAPPIVPGVGVVAGCTIASTWARVALVGVLDKLSACSSPNAQCSIAVYIDGSVISAEGTARPLVRILSRVTTSLQEGL